jgi:hypothetical protein
MVKGMEIPGPVEKFIIHLKNRDFFLGDSGKAGR